MKTSHRGDSLCRIALPSIALFPLCRGLAALPLARVGGESVAHPGTIVMSLDARAKPFPVARPMSLDNVMELVPVDLAKIVMTALFIPCQAGIGYRSEEHTSELQ